MTQCDLIAFDTEDNSKDFSDANQDHPGYEKFCTQIAAIDDDSGFGSRAAGRIGRPQAAGETILEPHQQPHRFLRRWAHGRRRQRREDVGVRRGPAGTKRDSFLQNFRLHVQEHHDVGRDGGGGMC